ncbi:MAG TPA: HAD family acid phosphatase [Opitutaceae bacterium]|nr:HAD family acid phosphatase [Opitutaceae bacterium]
MLAGCAATSAPGSLSKPELRRYYESGRYQSDLAAAAARAGSWLAERAAHRIPGEQLAVVFDIDETLISNWPEIVGADFEYVPAVWEAWEAEARAPALEPVRAVYLQARRLGLEVIVLSDRREHERSITERGLRSAGYEGYAALILKPDDSRATAETFKSAQRRRLAAEGRTIIANVGDQESDLAGGSAERTFKLPNPFYLTR